MSRWPGCPLEFLERYPFVSLPFKNIIQTWETWQICLVDDDLMPVKMAGSEPERELTLPIHIKISTSWGYVTTPWRCGLVHLGTKMSQKPNMLRRLRKELRMQGEWNDLQPGSFKTRDKDRLFTFSSIQSSGYFLDISQFEDFRTVQYAYSQQHRLSLLRIVKTPEYSS